MELRALGSPYDGGTARVLSSAEKGQNNTEVWERYYVRSLARRGSLGREDCYCEPEDLNYFLETQELWPEKDARILVVGCGTSGLSASLSSAGFAVAAVDCSSTVIEWMRERHPGIEWHVADVAAMHSRWDKHFALVLDKGVIGAASTCDIEASAAKFQGSNLNAPFVVPYGTAYLSEYRRMLRPGGWAVVVMPEKSAWLQQETLLTNTWADFRIAAISGSIIYAFRAPSPLHYLQLEEPSGVSFDSSCVGNALGVPVQCSLFALSELD